MDWLAIILISLAGILIIWQDFIQREISWYLLPVLLLGILIIGIQKLILMEYLYYILINGCILLILMGFLLIYYWIKERSIRNFVGKTIGLGDLLVFLTLCFGFSPINFVVFFLIGLFLTLIFHLLNTAIKPNANKQIPLAGYLALFLMLLSWLQFPLKIIDLFNDQYLFSYLTI